MACEGKETSGVRLDIIVTIITSIITIITIIAIIAIITIITIITFIRLGRMLAPWLKSRSKPETSTLQVTTCRLIVNIEC